MIGARLDQLPRRELALLECASVIGRRFDLRALVELARQEESGSHLLALALTRAGLVRPAPGPAGEDRYRFAHGLVRDAAYARIPKTQRADLHELLARRLLAEPGRTPAADDLAGHHLEQACRALRELGRDAPRVRGLGEEAAALLETAGRRAAARDDLPAAIALLERAGDPHRRQPAPRRGPPRAGSRPRGDRRERAEPGHAGPRDRGCDARRRPACGMARGAPRPGEAFRLVLGTGDELRDVAERAIAIFGELHDDAALALSWRRMAFVERREGHYGVSARAVRARRRVRARGR